MDTAKLEAYYEHDILPHYGVYTPGIVWQGHGSIAADVFAHHFTYGHDTYTLVFEDFPSAAHFVAEDNELVTTTDGRQAIDTRSQEYIENMTGFFTLFKEPSR